MGNFEVAAKSNEIPALTDLLAPFDLADVVVTADALHCQRGTAEYIVGRGGHYVFTVKNNQPSLRARLKALPWNEIPVSSSTAGRGHGRRERRTVKTTEVAAGVGFPHATQVMQVRRTVTRSHRKSVEVVYVICIVADGRRRPDPGHRVDPWTLGNREPPALGPRRRLRRGPRDDPHRFRSAGHGHDPQHRRQHPPPRRPRQHRRCPAASQPQPTPVGRPTSYRLTCSYTTLPGPWG
ncbi:ISAs1 family transposase [Rhodococcus zopfii]|uniref:ISAs1 family transposase n=1 Tax=Rhodococcus zopfii TaxID=43772 RepID=UPI003FA06F66